MHALVDKSLAKLIPLLKKDPVDSPITQGVLDGTFNGYAYTDNSDSPSLAIIAHKYAGFMHYVGRDPSGKEVQDIAEIALNYNSARDYCSWVEFAHCPVPVSSIIKMKHPKMRSYNRISWNHDRTLFSEAPVPGLPEGCTVRLLRKDDFNIEFLRFETELFWETTDKFLDTVFGTVAFNAAGSFMGVCGAVSDSEDFLEINIEVVSDSRRQGIGYAIGHSYIKECYKRGKKPHWDCFDHNKPSQALALKLGFTEVGRYPLVSWTY